ncbi:hypothetical protein [Pseudomonas fluorescens]|uniref:Uncharacterized protein n=1 Tax=Pseudomonas fluorescens TaxID=294 RepID=A0A5E7E2Q5_PSEFL|nr:hypothetical protein [Pseudomonas fluorescens]VVO19214.1 hypothetical protein PS723_04066 [Pseudomonas fluorescens]
MKISNLKTLRLVLSGALLGIAAANAFFGVEASGELMAGVLGAGGAFVTMKLLAIA